MVLDSYSLTKPMKTGLRAELYFYDVYQSEFKLEPLLDAGVKADFAGKKDGALTNFDVTTNLKYKDADKYIDVVRKRGRSYQIALVDLKKSCVDFFPIRFPVCPECNGFSH